MEGRSAEDRAIDLLRSLMRGIPGMDLEDLKRLASTLNSVQGTVGRELGNREGKEREA